MDIATEITDDVRLTGLAGPYLSSEESARVYHVQEVPEAARERRLGRGRDGSYDERSFSLATDLVKSWLSQLERRIVFFPRHN